MRPFIYLLLTFLILTSSSCRQKKLPVKKIAFIGRYDDLEGRSGSNEWFDDFSERSLRVFLEQLNEENGKVRLELEVFNIHQDPARSDSVYRMIAADPNFIWVLDNSWGHDMAGSRETIVDNQIPVLSTNAYKGYNDYGPSTLFLTDYETDIHYISAFAKKILRRDSVDFISENDVVFHDHFLQSFEKFDLTPTDVFTYTGQQNINKEDSIRLFDKLYAHFVLNGNNQKRVVLYNSHFMWGNEVLEFLNDHLVDSKFMSWSVPQSEYVEKLKNGNELIQHHRSHFAVSEPVLIKYKTLLEEDYEHFRWDGAASIMEYYRNAIDLLGNFIAVQENAREITANNMGRYLERVSKTVTTGGNEIFSFNDKGKMLHEKTFTVYSEEGISYYPYQLNQDFSKIPSMHLGIDLQSIYDIDLRSNSFKANFEFWLVGDALYSNAEELVRIKNLFLDDSVIELLYEKHINDRFLKRYSVAGKFHNTFSAADYPFDVQKLHVEIELLNPTDELRMTIDPVTFEEKVKDFRINNWKSLDYYVTVENNIYQDYISNVRKFAKNEVINIHFFSKRNIWGSMLQIILPLFFIGTVSIGILYVNNLAFSQYGNVIVGLFLSIIAFSINLAQLTPKFDDLTKADQLFLLTFVIVFFVFLYLILLSSKVRDRVIPSIPYVRTILTIVYPILFFLLSFF